ncbi:MULTISPECIES: hypothetical protein [Pseudomonas]|uniref:hypothetical protein n=1 Tax=Pseudomonas TaxID=286 RepID=UPI00055CBD80|nr:hypothetical protein [Pseudomonas sp.]MBF3053077.1 hypothetical protein [Pseudomonas aeruginosa]MDU4254240.1 hypothetical protein [Pseudomonas sp.]
MASESSISVTKIAAYAESPDDFIRAGGKAYNLKATQYGNRAHARIGRAPSMLVFAIAAVLIIAALLYFRVFP